MAQTTFEETRPQNRRASPTLDQSQNEKKKQKKFKGWKKTLLRLVSVRAFSSGSKKVSDAAPRSLTPFPTNTDTNLSPKSPPGLSGLKSNDEGAFSSSSAVEAAAAVSKNLYALAAPQLPSVSGLSSSTTVGNSSEATSLNLSLPTPSIPTITVTPTTPISPTGLSVNSKPKESNQEYDVSSPLNSDYFSLSSPSGHAGSTALAREQYSSSIHDTQVATSSSHVVDVAQPQPDTLAAETAFPDDTEATHEVEAGDKKKNKKKKKKTKKGSLNPTNLIGQAMEHSPNPLEVVKKGINTASSASANVGSIMNAGNSAVSNLVSSAPGPVAALGGGANKLTDSLPSLNRKDFDLMIPIGPVAFVLKGHIQRENLEIDAGLHVKVGFVTHKLGKVQGNLLTGVRIKFGLSGVLTGQARFYMPVKGEKGKKKKGKGKGKGKDDDESQAIVALEKEKDAEAAGGERSKWLWLDIKVTVFKEDIGPLSLPLIPLRFGNGNHKKTNSEALSVRSISISVIEDVEDGSRQVTTVRRSIDVDVVGKHRRSTSITTLTTTTTTAQAPGTTTRRSIDYPHHANHLRQLEAFSFCSSAGVRSLDLLEEPSQNASDEELEDWEAPGEGERGRVGFMVGYHS